MHRPRARLRALTARELGISKRIAKRSTLQRSVSRPPTRVVVRNVTQDNQGFLWLGAANGLRRYDGYSFMRGACRTQEDSARGRGRSGHAYRRGPVDRA